MTVSGLISEASDFDPPETLQRLMAAIASRGMSVLARVDHAAAASQVGMVLRPTEVILFGNPRAGTPLMQTAQTIGIDLPLKILVWQDETGRTWISYNDPAWLTARHGIAEPDIPAVSAMTHVLAAVAAQAARHKARRIADARSQPED